MLKYRYFSPRGVLALSPEGEPYGPFLEAYFAFVLLRLSSLPGRFAEVAPGASVNTFSFGFQKARTQNLINLPGSKTTNGPPVYGSSGGGRG